MTLYFDSLTFAGLATVVAVLVLLYRIRRASPGVWCRSTPCTA